MIEIVNAHQGTVWPLALSGDEACQPVLASAGSDGIRGWNAATGAPYGVYSVGMAANSLSLATSGDKQPLLAVAGDDGIYVYNALTGDALLSLGGDGPGFWCVAPAALPNGRLLFIGAGHDHSVYRWDALTGEPYGAPLVGHRDTVKTVAAASRPDGTVMIVSAGDDETLRCWDAMTGEPLGPPLTGHSSVVVAVSIRSDVILSGDVEGVLRRWHARDGHPAGTPIEAHRGGIINVALAATAKGLRAVSTGGDQRVRQWDLTTGELIDQTLTGVAVAVGVVRGIQMVAVGDNDGSITMQELASRN